MTKPLFVLDTNVFISAQLVEHAVSAKVFDKILVVGSIALSEAILREYEEVLYRKKLDKYLIDKKRRSVMEHIRRNGLMFEPAVQIDACRDRKDNMVLELAVCCAATAIISGDTDLKVLHPFRSIPIVTPAEFLAVFK